MPTRSEKDKIFTVLCEKFASDILMVETSKNLNICFYFLYKNVYFQVMKKRKTVFMKILG